MISQQLRPGHARSRSAAHLALGLAVTLTLSAIVVGPAAASDRALSATTAITAVVLDGDPGDPVTSGHPWTWVSPADAITVMDISSPTYLRLQFPGGTIDLAAPTGQTLAVGTYEGATRYPFQDPTVPGLSVTHDSLGCNTVTGRFVIHEAAFGSDGKPSAFAASIEQYCDGAAAATFGEVRIDSTVGLVAARLSPLGDADLFFGQQTIGGPGLTRTFTLTSAGNADLDIGAVSVVNVGGPGGFTIAAQTCSGATLAPGQTCTIDVHFAPVLDDFSFAEIRIADSGARAYHMIPVRGAGIVAPATNDAIDDPVTIPSLPYSTLADTSATTGDPGDPPCYGATNTVWFRFTPTTSQAYEASTLGSWYSTSLCVFRGTPSALVPVAGNDDDPAAGATSRVVFPAVAGTTYYLMAGANAGAAGGRLAFSLTVGPQDKVVSATGLGVNYATFYPYRDGYRDTVTIRGNLAEWATVSISIYSPTGTRVRLYSLGSRRGAYSQAWDGRNASGTALAAAKYRVVQRLKDVLGNTLTSTTYTTLSKKRLYTLSTSITRYGSQFAYYGDPGTGYVSPSKSSYYRGVRLSSGSSWAAVGYSFALPSAVTYKSVSFKVLGRSPNGRKAWIAIWNPSLGSYLDVDAYDVQRRAGPGYAWYGTSTSLATHQKSSRARAILLVAYESGAVVFDAAKVRLSITYTVLK